MILIVSNYRTGSTTFSKELGGDGSEWLHNGYGNYRSPGSDKVYKIMPNQFYYRRYYLNFKRDYLQKADKIYYTLRQDLSNQIESYFYALTTGDWHPDVAIQRTDYTDDHTINHCKNTVLKNLIWQKKIYDAFGGDLIWLEDRTQRRYTRKNYYTPLNFEIDVNVRDMFR